MSKVINLKNTEQKLITVCIIGKPNAGKSSLLNRILQQKLSIVSPKVQTTRSMITGIVTLDNVQIIMLDTPGIFEPKRSLEKAMVRCAWSSLHSTDVVLLIIDNTTKLDANMISILDKLESLKITPIFILNKIDINRAQKSENEKLLQQKFEDAIIFKISAITGKGVEELLNYIKSIAKISPWEYSADDLTTLPMRFLTSEITREKLFLELRDELPYNLTVQTDNWEEREDSIVIHQSIIVTKESHKIIILGKGASLIKSINIAARKDMEELIEKKIHLFLFVKIREEWQDKKEYYDYMNLSYIKTNK